MPKNILDHYKNTDYTKNQFKVLIFSELSMLKLLQIIYVWILLIKSQKYHFENFQHNL